jgi:hypothetical protein
MTWSEGWKPWPKTTCCANSIFRIPRRLVNWPTVCRDFGCVANREVGGEWLVELRNSNQSATPNSDSMNLTWPVGLNKHCRPHLKPTNKSYRVDETYIKGEGGGEISVSSARFLRANDRLSSHRQTRRSSSQTLYAQSYRRIWQPNATGDKRGQEPLIPSCVGSAESRRRRSPPGCVTPMFGVAT